MRSTGQQRDFSGSTYHGTIRTILVERRCRLLVAAVVAVAVAVVVVVVGIY